MATLKTLYAFTRDNALGVEPRVGLTIDAEGNLIGTNSAGGVGDNGTVFELPDEGNGVYGTPIALLTFTGQGGSFPLGSDPEGSVFIDASGNLIGMTLAGGQNLTNPDGTPNDGEGTVYEITNTGSGYVAPSEPLLTFHPNPFDPVVDPQGHDIFGPEGNTAGLVADSDGNLYGTSNGGGFVEINFAPMGDVYEIKYTNGSYASTPTVLVNFEGIDGRNPEGPLIIDKNGNLFGTTTSGGPSQTNGAEDNDGVVFELTRDNQGNYSQPIVLASFTGIAGATPGAHPLALVMDGAGDLFGTTTDGGIGGAQGGSGTVFEIAYSNGSYQPARTLATFTNSNGAEPTGNLLIDAAGNLFGTTFAGGGPQGFGTVFEIASAGGYNQLTTLITFTDGASGGGPEGLTADAEGNLFGTTLRAGAPASRAPCSRSPTAGSRSPAIAVAPGSR